MATVVRRVLVLLVTLASACDAGGAPDGASSSGTASAPDLSADWLILGVGDAVVGGPEVGTFQDALDGWSYVFDYTNRDDPAYLCQHDKPQLAAKLEEGNWSDEIVCSPPAQDPPTTTQAHTGPPGTNLPPTGYKSWLGGATGGCGVWATLMCDRILGLTHPSTPVTQKEWNDVFVEIGADASTGGSLLTNVQDRYDKRGYCTTRWEVYGGPNDYNSMKNWLDRGCDVKVAMWRRDEQGKLSGGHIETVVAADASHVATNSWGLVGSIRGGTHGDFQFKRGDLDAVLKNGDLAYEPDATTMQAAIVCPCSAFEALGLKILKGG